MSAAKPESAAAVQARAGAGAASIERKGRKAREEFVLGCVFAGSAGFTFHVAGRDASHSAPAAATRFNATPTQVVARRPIAGIRKKPAAIAPAAAPAVLAAYSTPVSAAPLANQPAAIGNVAPIAAAGTPSSARLIATRTTANCAGAVPSAYAHARAGTDEASARGSRSAEPATTSSRTAYARSFGTACCRSLSTSVRRAIRRPASHAPTARPPMNAASTVLAAATV